MAAASAAAGRRKEAVDQLVNQLADLLGALVQGARLGEPRAGEGPRRRAPGEMLEVVAAKAANAMWALRRELQELKGMAFTEQYDVMEKGVAQARQEYSALDARLQEGLAEIEQEVLDTIRALETQLGVGSGLGGAEGAAEGGAEGAAEGS